MTGARGDRLDEAVVALSQAPSGSELAPLAEAMAAPLTSAQRAVASLVTAGYVTARGDRRPAFALDPTHPAAPERLQLALRVLPVQSAVDIVLRANPAVEFAGDDLEGIVVVLSPFAEPEDVLNLQSTIERILAGRTPVPTISLTDRDQLRSAMRDDPSIRGRGLRLRVIAGSAARTFPDPDRHGRPEGTPLGRVHPAVGRIPRAEIQALADQFGIARIRVFGSAVRSDFRPDSDIDVLVELKPGAQARLAMQVAIQRLLESAFHRDVDVVTPHALDATIRARAEHDGVTIHG